jgi:hypothetical protein
MIFDHHGLEKSVISAASNTEVSDERLQTTGIHLPPSNISPAGDTDGLTLESTLPKEASLGSSAFVSSELPRSPISGVQFTTDTALPSATIKHEVPGRLVEGTSSEKPSNKDSLPPEIGINAPKNKVATKGLETFQSPSHMQNFGLLDPITQDVPSSGLFQTSAIPRGQVENTIGLQHPSQVFSSTNISNITDAVVTIKETGGLIDVSLTPEDLGRLTLKIDQSVQGLQVTIAAERLDTQEIMRRHIELLQQQFRSLGFENLSFAFEQDAQPEPQSQQDNALSANVDDSRSEHINQIPLGQMLGGLDIRI